MSVERTVILEGDRDKYLKELSEVRTLVNGTGAPANLINGENYPMLYRYSPRSLEALEGIAESNLESDFKKIELARAYPEIWFWPDDKERAFLISAAILGLANEALTALKRDHERKIKDMSNNRAMSFGV